MHIVHGGSRSTISMVPLITAQRGQLIWHGSIASCTKIYHSLGNLDVLVLIGCMGGDHEQLGWPNGHFIFEFASF